MADPLTDRAPPKNRDAERSVLGGVLRDPHVLPDVLAILGADSFGFDYHQRIFAAIVGLSSRGAPVELVSVYEELKRSGDVENIGGPSYLAEIWDAVPTGAHAVHHAEIVRDAATLRSLIGTLNELLREAYSPTMSAADLLALAERKLFALSAEASTGVAEPRRVGEIVSEALGELTKRVETGDAITGISTGYGDLDAVLGGLTAGEMIVVGARPSVGKTAISLNVAERMARNDIPVLFFSLEMPAKSLGGRLLSMGSDVPMSRMSRPRDLTGDQLADLSLAASALSATPIYVVDTTDLTAAQVASAARRAVKKHGVKFVVIDYLSLMRPENPRDNRTLQIGTLALRVKQMARSLDIPVMLLAQLNRESEGQNRKPRLSDLRDSGEIEQHADRVILLHREASLPAHDAVWPVDLIVAKNRNGPTGDVRLNYRRPTMRFENAPIPV